MEKFIYAHFQARVDRINVDGLGRTKDDIVLEAVGDLFKVSNFEEVSFISYEIVI